MTKKDVVSAVVFVTLIVLLLMWGHHEAKSNEAKREKVLYNSLRLAQEWAYFMGQKEAITGDVRIKYNESTKNYSWTKSCWDEGLTPIFDPSKSENMNYFATKENLLK